jgi:recombination protein RecR
MRPPVALDKLMRQLSKLPGLGPRSARRAAFHLLRQRETHVFPLIDALKRAAEDIYDCPQCGNWDQVSPCAICQDPNRDETILCVVEDIADLWALERAGAFKGRYHVLGGTLSALDGRGPDDLKLADLWARLSDTKAQEIILALNPTLEGQTTAHYIMDQLQNLGHAHFKTTHLAYGIPMGGELDYLDEGTLTAALRERRDFK